MPMRIPAGMRPYLDRGDMTGRVSRVFVRPVKRKPTVETDAWVLGSEQDHHFKRTFTSKRGVTLIQSEHVEVVRQLSGADVDAALLRRNVVTRGFNLLMLVGRRFSVGDVVLEGTELCHPCNLMEELIGPGGYAAMFGLGGLCAKVVEPGEGVIRVGAAIELLPDAQ